MKEITFYGPDFNDVWEKTRTSKARKAIKFLLMNPEFQRKVTKIRNDLGLSSVGYTGNYLDSLSGEENLEKRLKCWIPLLSVLYNKRDFQGEIAKQKQDIKAYEKKTGKKININSSSIKSQKDQFQSKITELRQYSGLPLRLQNSLAQYVLWGKFSLLEEHARRWQIRVFEESGQNKLFIEIGDGATEKDIIQAYQSIKRWDLKKTHKIPEDKGGWYPTYENFWRDKIITEGNNLPKELEELSAQEKATARKRYKDHQSKKIKKK